MFVGIRIIAFTTMLSKPASMILVVYGNPWCFLMQLSKKIVKGWTWIF